MSRLACSSIQLPRNYWQLKPYVTIGLSLKTQILYVVVFVTRYLDLFTGDFVSIYNTVMKLFYIGSSCYIIYLMRVKYRSASRFLLSAKPTS